MAHDDAEPLTVDTPGWRFRAQFTPDLPVSALGALVFFAQYLAATGAFDALIADTPLCYASNRAHSPRACSFWTRTTGGTGCAATSTQPVIHFWRASG